MEDFVASFHFVLDKYLLGELILSTIESSSLMDSSASTTDIELLYTRVSRKQTPPTDSSPAISCEADSPGSSNAVFQALVMPCPLCP